MARSLRASCEAREYEVRRLITSPAWRILLHRSTSADVRRISLRISLLVFHLHTRMIRRVVFSIIFCGMLAALEAPDVRAQTVVRYGAEFLAGGVGGRALGMGGAHVALAGDASAGYWNPAGLSRLTSAEISYMHAERFAGVVSFDYGAGVYPINERSTVGVSFFRSGVNDIKNTLDAWDPDRNQPRPNPEDYITTFSAADYAFFVSYARAFSDRLAGGVTAKVIRRSIGNFADAWGYSFDVGVQYSVGRWQFGANAQDLSTMLQTWSVNSEAVAPIGDVFGETLPVGGTEVVLPVLRLGSGYVMPMGEHRMTLGMDLDLAFDGQKANVYNLGEISMHPRFGAEYAFRETVALRAGINRVATAPGGGVDIVPTVGAGINVSRFTVDYGFGDFAGMPSELGYSHRISASVSFGPQRPAASF
jgi:hypothetical protein